MKRNEEAKKLLSEIVDDIIYTKLSLTAILRKYLRIAQLLDLQIEQDWAHKELNGYLPTDTLPLYRILNCKKRYSWSGVLPYHISINKFLKDKFYELRFENFSILESIPKLENSLQNGISYFLSKQNLSGVVVDDILDIISIQIEEIIQKVQNELFTKTSQLQIILEFDLVSEEIFNEAKEFVDSSLNIISQDALNKITSAYRDLNDANTPIRWSQIALACIDGLVDFANSIYKKEYLPNGEVKPIREHFVKKIKFTLNSVVQSKEKLKYIESLGSYIKNLKDYLEANKHRSDLITKNDARRCVIYTYLIINDVLEEILKEPENK